MKSLSKPKHIVITGGVASSLGKGIIAASLGKLLQARGYRVTIQKFDPYINIDAGTMSPLEHGECYVTDDGAETDLDLGHYERFLNTSTSQYNNITAGRIYNNVISKERRGDYLGETVQVIPHITDEIKSSFLKLADTGNYDIIITEVGGSVGDIESLPFIEAIRQLQWELGNEDLLAMHLTLIPYLKAAGELKTKPTQHSVKQLQSLGISPKILICRTEYPINDDIRKKLALFCNVTKDAIIEAIDADTIYEVPMLMQSEKLDIMVLKQLSLPIGTSADLQEWMDFVYKLKNPKLTRRIGIVGKYTSVRDAYKSVHEALIHASVRHSCYVDVVYIKSDDITNDNVEGKLKNLHGIIIPGGFGDRGISGKLAAISYARTHKVPLFGLCLGMQCIVIDIARNLLGWDSAASLEHDSSTSYPMFTFESSQDTIQLKGGTCRLGAQPCQILQGTKVSSIYGVSKIFERHRHRYEFNQKYQRDLEKVGLLVSGVHPDSGLVEIMEYTHHPWMIGTQFHPELKSTVLTPHPLFISFLGATISYAG